MPQKNFKLLSVVLAADICGVSPHTLRAWLRQRRLPHVRLGRRVLLDPSDLRRFIGENRIDEAR